MAHADAAGASAAELLDWAHALPPACPPGIAHAYSNTGYLLLAAIVERVADQDFSSYRQQYLFRPLGLERTFVDDGRVILPQAARGLHPGAPWRYAEPMDMSVAWGVYDLASSAGDLCRWLEALQRGEALPARLASLMLDVSALEYAYGFYGEDWVLAGRQLRLAQHFGDVNGFFSFIHERLARRGRRGGVGQCLRLAGGAPGMGFGPHRQRRGVGSLTGAGAAAAGRAVVRSGAL
ncbi:beta-lactamase family protein [Chromobacterium haemolyticum]|nr:beta-lactamase family protein [Chromobacterium haemolyticum]